MLDPATIRLNETLHCERLHAAAEARQWRATCVAVPSPIARLRQAIGNRLIRLGQRMQAPVAQAHVYH